MWTFSFSQSLSLCTCDTVPIGPAWTSGRRTSDPRQLIVSWNPDRRAKNMHSILQSLKYSPQRNDPMGYHFTWDIIIGTNWENWKVVCVWLWETTELWSSYSDGLWNFYLFYLWEEEENSEQHINTRCLLEDTRQLPRQRGTEQDRNPEKWANIQNYFSSPDPSR